MFTCLRTSHQGPLLPTLSIAGSPHPRAAPPTYPCTAIPPPTRRVWGARDRRFKKLHQDAHVVWWRPRTVARGQGVIGVVGFWSATVLGIGAAWSTGQRCALHTPVRGSSSHCPAHLVPPPVNHQVEAVLPSWLPAPLSPLGGLGSGERDTYPRVINAGTQIKSAVCTLLPAMFKRTPWYLWGEMGTSALSRLQHAPGCGTTGGLTIVPARC